MKTLVPAEAVQELGNRVALGLQEIGSAARHVSRTDGRITGWRLFAFGPFSITRNGVTVKGEFLPEHADAILEYHETKGTPIPLDADHATFHLAAAAKVDEADLVAALGKRRLALGFGSLGRDDDGLWLSNVQWTDIGSLVMKAGAYRYFSPVLRGLEDGRLRITSVALTNEPAIDRLDAIAASADDGDDGCRDALSLADLVGRARRTAPQGKEQHVKKLLELLGAVLGMDAIALADDGKVPADVATKLAQLRDELPGLRAARALGAKVRDCLALGAEADEAKVEGTLRGLMAKGAAHDALKSRVDALELAAETDKRQKVIDRGLAEGKLTKAMIEGDWCKGQNAVALEAFLAVAPVVVPPGKTVDKGALPGAGSDQVALTAEEDGIRKAMGWTREQMLDAKKLQAGQQNQN